MGRIKFVSLGESRELADGEPLNGICEEVGVPFACTEGVCGTCTIEVVGGMENLSPLTQEEKDFFGESACERLACQCHLLSGEVEVKF